MGGFGAHNPGTLTSSLTGLPPEEDIMIDRCYKHPFTLRRLDEGSAWPFLALLTQ